MEGENSVRGFQQQRERRAALDGDAEYKKFLQSERRRVNNKSFQNGQEEEVPEVLSNDAAFEQQQQQIQSKVEKLYNNCARLGNFFIKKKIIYFSLRTLVRVPSLATVS